jgi:hypothetical protein
MFLRNVGYNSTTRRHIPEDDTLHNYSCENLKSYMVVEYLKVLFRNQYGRNEESH